MFTAEGPPILRAAREAGADRIFLDLKLHDIPNTVAGAVRSVRGGGLADYLTIHTGGGPEMMAAAVEAAGDDLALLGVTVLTSIDTDAKEAIGLNNGNIAWHVHHRAGHAIKAGVPGLVASPREVGLLREHFPDVLLVIPGIRLPDGDVGDQKRVSSPWDAIEAGADLLVLGRMVRGADDPDAVLEALHDRLGPLI